MKTRCSSLPRFFGCASSEKRTDAPYAPMIEPATLGSAAHEGLGSLVRTGTMPNITELAHQWNVERDDLSMLMWNGKRLWEQLNQHFPNPRVEQKLASSIVKGTADVIQHDQFVCIILDWKTGYVQGDHYHQLMGYAHAARETYGMPSSGRITIVTGWLRQGEVETDHVTADDLERWEADYRAQKALVGEQYGPADDTCIGCRRQLNCQAREKFVRSAALSLAPYSDEQLAIPRETIGALDAKAAMLERALKAYKAARTMTILMDGPLIVSDRKQLEIRSYTKHLIDVRKAWPIFERYGFNRNEMNAVLSLKKDKAMKIVAGKAATGSKGTAKEDCLKELQDAGAVTEIGYTKVVRVNRPTKEITDGPENRAGNTAGGDETTGDAGTPAG